MPPLISCKSIAKSFSTQELFKNISFGIDAGDRLGLVGPNGSGKSTLLKILGGLETPDSGEVIRSNDLKLAYLAQSEKFADGLTVEEILLHEVEHLDDREKYALVTKTLKQTGFEDFQMTFGSLSGGWRKRLAIAAAFMKEPDLLLMDEPTNHLDLEGILWLEGLLKNARFSFVLISHDRYFLENVTNRIMEINRTYPEGFFKIEGNYSGFLDKKMEFLAGQQEKQQSLANKLKRETEWLRRGPKARTTKAKSRIDDAARLKEEFHAVKGRNDQNKSVNIEFDASGRQTKKLIECIKVSKELGGRQLFSKTDLVLSPGFCLGLMGKNGSGKSTFMKLLTGELEPDEGKVKFAEQLKVVHFDQKRESLDPEEPLRKSLSPDGGDHVLYQGRSVHVATWAKRFLFEPMQLDMPVGKLSGGEQARILIARLMLQPADVLLLDEPTNDLDIPSLEVLEESLEEFPGAVVLVTHDRFLLNRLSDKILGLDGQGNAEYFADYFQWQDNQQQDRKGKKESAGSKKPAAAPKKLSYKEEIELEGIEKQIHLAEGELQKLQNILGNVASNPEKIQEVSDSINQAQEKIDDLFQRWEFLEKKQKAYLEFKNS